MQQQGKKVDIFMCFFKYIYILKNVFKNSTWGNDLFMKIKLYFLDCILL